MDEQTEERKRTAASILMSALDKEILAERLSEAKSSLEKAQDELEQALGEVESQRLPEIADARDSVQSAISDLPDSTKLRDEASEKRETVVEEIENGSISGYDALYELVESERNKEAIRRAEQAAEN